MCSEGRRSRHSTREAGRQLKRTLDGCSEKCTITSTGNDAYTYCPYEPSAGAAADADALADAHADAGAGAENDALLGIGSRVCSKNSSMCGLMIVSSGMLCSVIHANRDAFLVPTFLEVVVWGDGTSSGTVFDS